MWRQDTAVRVKELGLTLTFMSVLVGKFDIVDEVEYQSPGHRLSEISSEW